MGRPGSSRSRWNSINRMRCQPEVCSCMFETSLYKARNKALRQYIPMVLSLAAFLADWEDSRVSVWNVTHSFIIRNSVAFLAPLTLRPLNENHLRMDHVWENCGNDSHSREGRNEELRLGANFGYPAHSHPCHTLLYLSSHRRFCSCGGQCLEKKIIRNRAFGEGTFNNGLFVFLCLFHIIYYNPSMGKILSDEAKDSFSFKV